MPLTKEEKELVEQRLPGFVWPSSRVKTFPILRRVCPALFDRTDPDALFWARYHFVKEWQVANERGDPVWKQKDDSEESFAGYVCSRWRSALRESGHYYLPKGAVDAINSLPFGFPEPKGFNNPIATMARQVMVVKEWRDNGGAVEVNEASTDEREKEVAKIQKNWKQKIWTGKWSEEDEQLTSIIGGFKPEKRRGFNSISDDELRILAKDKTVNDIAKLLGKSYTTTYAHLRSRGIKCKLEVGGGIDLSRIRELAETKNGVEIAEVMGLSVGYTSALMNKHGIKSKKQYIVSDKVIAGKRVIVIHPDGTREFVTSVRAASRLSGVPGSEVRSIIMDELLEYNGFRFYREGNEHGGVSSKARIAKRIVLAEKDGVVVEYARPSAVSDALDVTRSTVSNALTGKISHVRGWKLYYKEGR